MIDRAKIRLHFSTSSEGINYLVVYRDVDNRPYAWWCKGLDHYVEEMAGIRERGTYGADYCGWPFFAKVYPEVRPVTAYGVLFYG